jgi:hypothetical protein
MSSNVNQIMSDVLGDVRLPEGGGDAIELLVVPV